MPKRKPPQPPPRRDRAVLYWGLAIAALAVVPYLNALGNGFVLDDTRLIRDDVRIRSLANIPHLFASSYWGVQGAQALYRPLVLTTYALNYAGHGLSPSGYIAVNIALHAAVALLLFALVRAIGGSAFAAGAAALVFAAHPVHTEAVAGISGRPELLAAFFVLAALLLHRRATDGSAGPAGYRAATAVCFAAALLSKESAFTLLLVLPVMDVLAGARRPRSLRDYALDYAPLVLVAVGYLLIRRAVLGGIVIADQAIAPLDNPLVPMAKMPLGDWLGATRGQAWLTSVAVFTQYARLLVWPLRLSPDYSYNQIPIVTSASDPRFVAGALLATACLAAMAVLWRRRPIAAFGLALLALTFSIVSNVFVTIGTICAERLLYLPSAGAAIAVAIALERLATSPARRRIAFAVLALLLCAGTVRIFARDRDWASETTLWTAAIRTSPGSARVQSEYGRVLMAQAQDADAAGRREDAERLYSDARSHFDRAVQIYPSYSLPLDGLAMIDSVHGRFDEAARLYGRALQAWPGNYASLTNWASMLWDRSRQIGSQAMTLRKEGRIAESDALVAQADAGFRQAREKIDRAVQMAPDYAQAHLVRAMILDGYADDRDGAIAEFATVLRLEPGHPQRAQIEAEMQRLQAR